MSTHAPAIHVRASGTYLIDGMQLVEQHVALTFPSTFDVEELRDETVRATVFAIRPVVDYPLWCEFKHPRDGRWRSVFARREWTSSIQDSSSAKRGFKRPR